MKLFNNIEGENKFLLSNPSNPTDPNNAAYGLANIAALLAQCMCFDSSLY